MLDSYKKLLSSNTFKDWKNKNKDSYLCSCFNILENEDRNWQFDFYNKNNTITSFIMNTTIEIDKDQEIFQKEKTELKELNLEEVKLKLSEALKLIKTKYKDNFFKTIAILQPYVWNITLISSEFKILNVKIDAITKKIISEKYESVLKFKQ